MCAITLPFQIENLVYYLTTLTPRTCKVYSGDGEFMKLVYQIPFPAVSVDAGQMDGWVRFPEEIFNRFTFDCAGSPEVEDDSCVTRRSQVVERYRGLLTDAIGKALRKIVSQYGRTDPPFDRAQICDKFSSVRSDDFREKIVLTAWEMENRR